MDTNLLPTQFSPTQLEILRALVSTAQSKQTRPSGELHNLEKKLEAYVETARAATRHMAPVTFLASAR